MENPIPLPTFASVKKAQSDMKPLVAKPFVKWVGGKTQLLDEVKKLLPSDFAQRPKLTYVEPFVGGGAVLFWILQRYPNIQKAVINDINERLIITYRTIKDNLPALISLLQGLQKTYLPLSHEERTAFYLTQRERYNAETLSSEETAALFIFLNRTCFNGLYRVNARGGFNVPHGKYAQPRICDEDNLYAVSQVLQRVEILHGDFSNTEPYAGADAFFYFDPPYKPITQTSAFTAYSSEGFGDSEQIRLRDFCQKISQAGATFVASNSDPTGTDPLNNFFDCIYNAFQVKRVYASRMVNSKADRRGPIPELMISNIVKC